MGLTLLKQLLHLGQKEEETVVFMVNRGNVYWNGLSKKYVQMSEGMIKQIVADRKSDNFVDKVVAQIKSCSAS